MHLADRIYSNTVDRESEIEHFMEDVASVVDVLYSNHP